MMSENRRIIVIGGSAGGVEAVKLLAAGLPEDLPAAIFVVIHFPPDAVSLLPGILTRAGKLPASNAEDGEPIKPGHIYVAPPDSHLLISDGRIELGHGPRENGHRPAIDPLFRTAAQAYRSRVIGIILSGTLDDGTMGMAQIKRRGGVAIVQEPDEALYPDMPRSAIEYVKVDHVLPVYKIRQQLCRLVCEPIGVKGPDAMPDTVEHDVAEEGGVPLSIDPPDKAPSSYTCPECGGALWEHTDNEFVRYNCHVGHSYTAEALIAAQAEDIEAALWSAVRALEENALLAKRMAERAERRKTERLVNRYRTQADEAHRRAELLKSVLLRNPPSAAKR